MLTALRVLLYVILDVLEFADFCGGWHVDLSDRSLNTPSVRLMLLLLVATAVAMVALVLVFERYCGSGWLL